MKKRQQEEMLKCCLKGRTKSGQGEMKAHEGRRENSDFVIYGGQKKNYWIFVLLKQKRDVLKFLYTVH